MHTRLIPSSKFHVSSKLSEFTEKYKHLQKGETLENEEVRVGVRIITKRESGNALKFYVTVSCTGHARRQHKLTPFQKQEGVSVQIMCQLQYASGDVSFEKQHEHLQRGDIIGVVGFPGRTSPKKGGEGELSIFAKEVVLLTPCLRMLPTEHFGFKDQEQRHRQRFLDLIMNDRTRDTFVTRTKIVKYIRKYFDERDFLEVQTVSTKVF